MNQYNPCAFCRDHLHLRGENSYKARSGSQFIGITSTYVEKTSNLLFLFKEKKDHLHLRGEN